MEGAPCLHGMPPPSASSARSGDITKMPTESENHSVVPDSLWPRGLYSPWNSLGQNTGVGSLSLLQGIFPTQRSNPDLLHCRRILYCLSHQGSPRILEWIAYPFSRGCSCLRSQNRVSCIAGGFFTSWATREAQRYNYMEINTRSKAIMKRQSNALQMKKNKTKLQKKN